MSDHRDERPDRNRLMGWGLDGAGLGPASTDGQTRITQGEDYVLMGGSEETHEGLQEIAQYIAESCRAEGTTLGDAPKELLREIVDDLASDLDDVDSDSDADDPRR